MPTTTRDMTGTGRRAGLAPTTVIDHALALVEERGADALTMRNLAADLGVSTTTIYWHVGGRDELITALIQRLSERQAAIDVVGDTPRDRVMSVTRHVWHGALAHRNVTALAHQVGATSLLELPLERALARELDAAGVRGPAGRDALRSILMCVAGFLVVAFRSDRAHGRLTHTQPQDLWAEVVDDRIDAATIAAMAIPPDLDSVFDTTLTAVIAAFVPESNARGTRRQTGGPTGGSHG